MEENKTESERDEDESKQTRNELKSSDSNTYRLKNKEQMKNGEEQQNIFTESPTKMSRKHYGGTPSWIFFTETRFFTQNS